MKRQNKSDTKNYYIQRKLKRFVQIDKKKIDIEEKKADKFIVVHSEEEFKDRCDQNLKKSIHFLQTEKDKEYFIWSKSKGPISDISEFIIQNEEACFSIEEEKILNERTIQNERILIISAEPGMGKSSILDQFTQNSSLENFFLKIVLNNFTDSLKSLKEKKIELKGDQDILEFILKYLFHKTQELEISILKNLLKERKLILMFDGVDEVSDFKEEVKSLIKVINVKYEYLHILLTTRNHLKTELEDYFETISFNLNTFTEDDQLSFLYKYWCYSLGKNESGLGSLAEVLIKKMNSTLNKRIGDLIGIPLQTKMIADIFSDKLELNKDITLSYKIDNIADLYKKFIEKKIEIKYKEKNNFEIEKDQRMYNREKKFFYIDHTKLSQNVLMGKKNNDLVLDEEELIKYGLIISFKNKIPTFLHQSFAEYFLAENSLENIDNDLYEEILRKIMREKSHFLIRRFLNDLLENETIKENKTNYFKIKYDAEIENCCTENLPNILNYLLKTREANIIANNEFLLVASDKGYKEIFEILK